MLRLSNKKATTVMKIKRTTTFFDINNAQTDVFVENIEIKASNVTTLMLCLNAITRDATRAENGALVSERFNDTPGGYEIRYTVDGKKGGNLLVWQAMLDAAARRADEDGEKRRCLISQIFDPRA